MAGHCELGVTGLATMGANLARSVARHGFPVAVHNRTESRTRELLDRHGGEGELVGISSTAEFVAVLAPPRRNLLQGQRDFFGAHTYQRIDRPGSFHARWSTDGQEVEA
jgi:6-phosphogluconate dehydrogenase